MQISGISANTAIPGNQAHTAMPGGYGQFGSMEFMQILMAQLTHQNPLEPMNDSDMMNQFAQLNSLQELQTMRMAFSQSAAANQASYAASLIGKVVKAQRADGSSIEGVVEGVSVENGMLTLTVGNEKIALADVTEIKGAGE